MKFFFIAVEEKKNHFHFDSNEESFNSGISRRLAHFKTVSNTFSNMDYVKASSDNKKPLSVTFLISTQILQLPDTFTVTKLLFMVWKRHEEGSDITSYWTELRTLASVTFLMSHFRNFAVSSQNTMIFKIYDHYCALPVVTRFWKFKTKLKPPRTRKSVTNIIYFCLVY